MAGKKTFVGFGFGPIQSALFLFEAWQSGNFDQYIVAEVDQTLVRAVSASGGSYAINIAHPDGVERVTIDGVTLLHPERDRNQLLNAVSSADEIATALPSVDFYDSVAPLLRDGLARRDALRPVIVYASENNIRAAEMLSEQLGVVEGVQCLNTVIGKMSGVIDDVDTIERMSLATLTSEMDRAVLVEAFNRILVSRVTLQGVNRGIDVFVEKDDLLLFEEAKLYGHNAIHALIGYLAALCGLSTMAEVAANEGIMSIARSAFVEESGAALVRKYEQLGDELFTEEGYARYADDLLERMVNPHLNDLVSRVTRDAERKLGFDDRLFGTMRLALAFGVEPVNMAKGAAAALLSLSVSASDARTRLLRIWGDDADDQAERLINLTVDAMESLKEYVSAD